MDTMTEDEQLEALYQTLLKLQSNFKSLVDGFNKLGLCVEDEFYSTDKSSAFITDYMTKGKIVTNDIGRA